MNERTRPKLSLYSLNRPALQELAKELKEALLADDRPRLAKLLGLGPELTERLSSSDRAVDWFLRPESDPSSAPIFGSLRRVAKKRALELSWTSEEASLEGRLRHFETIREDPGLADLVDKLLDPNRLPWFLVRPGATCGWLDEERREKLASDLRSLRPALPKELQEFADAIDGVLGPVVAHDML